MVVEAGRRQIHGLPTVVLILPWQRCQATMTRTTNKRILFLAAHFSFLHQSYLLFGCWSYPICPKNQQNHCREAVDLPPANAPQIVFFTRIFLQFLRLMHM